MAYIKTVWVTGDVISEAKANHWETQYDEAVKFVTVFLFGGRDTYLESSTTYPTGGAVGSMVPGSAIWPMDPVHLAGSAYRLETHMRVNNPAAQGFVGLFNLTDASETVMAGSLITGTVGGTGDFLQSGGITFPASGLKFFAIKSRVNNAAYGVSVWGIRLVRIW